MLAYAAFAHGATDIPDESYAQVALAALGLLSCAAWLGGRRLSISTTPWGWAALALLGAFAFWSGISLLWTVAPEGTWLETNRALSYALVLVLGLAVGSRLERAVERIAVGWLIVAVAVALYALGGKLVPSLLNHTAVFSRLRAPLDYWNALALVCVLGAPVAMRVATDSTRPLRARLAGLAALQLLFVVAGLTYSRGGVLAMVVAVLALTALGGARLRGLAVVGLAALATVAPLAYAFSSHTLTTDSIPLAARVRDGRVLALIMLASLAALLLVAHRLAQLEDRVAWTPVRSRRAWQALGVAVVVGLLVGVAALAGSSRGVTGSISHQVDNFTSVRKDPITDPSRLLSTSSGNRWVWWEEAVGAFVDRPLQGWGPGSFPVTHLLYRKPPPLPVRQPHSVPLQFLAETGVVGALLALGAIGCLLTAVAVRVRSLAPGRGRDLAVACLVAGAAWTLHGVYDWDWDIPGVTFPALLLLGVAAAAPRSPAREQEEELMRADGGAPLRIAALILATLALCAFAMSAVLPAWSQTKALNALTSVTDHSTPAQLESAAAAADLAARLNPLGDQALIYASTIAARRGRTADEHRYLLQAVGREPYDVNAWTQLAFAAAADNDRGGAYDAARKALSLDPLNTTLAPFVAFLALGQTPPAASATATGTPLG